MKTFKTNETYSARFIGDYDNVVSFKIIKRTAKTITAKVQNAEKVLRVKIIDGIETVKPFGNYSMSMTLKAI